MTFGSLFAGIGGFDLGLERAGMECRWQVEIDDYASRVLAKHWPHVTRWGDVRTFPPGPPDEWRVDLICAGVPCQPVSHAGKQKGADDERWMWGEALRVIADIQPAFFVAENPIGILNHDGGRTFRGLLRAIASVGYVCEWHVIAASDVGAPHRRQRVWLVCFRDWNGSQTDASCSNAYGIGLYRAAVNVHGGFELRHKQECLAGQMGANVADADCGRLQVERLAEHGEQQGQAGSIANRCSPWRRWQGSPELAGHWGTEPKLGRLAYGVPSRVDRLRCLGNAVVPQIVELIGRAIIEHQQHDVAGT